MPYSLWSIFDSRSTLTWACIAGRLEEASLIQEQVGRLQEAVKAAQVRTSRRPANRSARLRKMLLKPLKMLCYSAATSGHALALPAGIQDSDLVRPAK